MAIRPLFGMALLRWRARAISTEIKDTTGLWQTRPEVYLPAWKGHGPHPTRLKLRSPQDTPLSVKDLLNGLPKAAWTRATITEGSPKALSGVLGPSCASLKPAAAYPALTSG